MDAYPTKRRQARLFIDDSQDPLYIAPLHTFAFLIPKSHETPPLDGIAVDVSSMQYGNALRSMTISKYNRTRVQTATRIAYPFGHHIMTHFSKLPADKDWDTGVMKLEAGIRVINTTVFRWAVGLGGRQNLEAMSHNSFIAARNQLSQQLDVSMRELREDIDIAIFSFDPGAQLYGVVQEKGSDEHFAMMGILKARLYQDNF